MKKDAGVKQSLAARTRWLFTKEGFPVPLSILAGLIIGYFLSGIVVLLVATLAGFVVLKLFNRLPFHLKPWQDLVNDLCPVVAKLFFSLAFLLPIADYMTLPSGHTPNTIPKYISIVFAIPKNLFSRPSGDIFPGFVFIVFISIILMYWGSMNLEKIDHWLLALSGLLLYTFSPTLTGYLTGRPGVHILKAFFGVGYYFAWIGLALLLVARVLPRFLKAEPAPVRRVSGAMSLLAPLVALGALSHLNVPGFYGHSLLSQLFDFESAHHTFAGIFSGGVAGVSAGVIVGQSAEGGDESEIPEDAGEDIATGEVGPPPEEPPDVPEEPPVPQGPVPSTNPDDPPGTTVETNPDKTLTVRQPNGTVSTYDADGKFQSQRLPDGTTNTMQPDGTIINRTPDKVVTTIYPDGTTYSEGPDGSSLTSYPDGTKKEWSPETGLQVTKPSGEIEITLPDGRTGGSTLNKDGSIDVKSPYGGTLHCPKEGYPEGSLTTYDGTVMTMNKDGSASISTPGGTMKIDKDGNMSGSMTDEQGNKITIKEDGSFEGETPDGDKITVDENGLRAKFHDGSFINADADGKMNGHIKTEDGGTMDVNTDDADNIHIKDDKGNTADINSDGNVTSAHIKDDKGTVDLNTDDKGTMHIKDDKGNTADISQDGNEAHIKDEKGNSVDIKGGNVTDAHVKDEQGTLDLTTDDKGNMHIKDDKGNTQDIKSDGSGEMKGPDGAGSWDAQGNSDITDSKGTTMKTKSDGSGYVQDKQGNRIDLHRDGSVTTTEAGGKTATYTKEQMQQMQAQSGAAQQTGGNYDANAGGR